MILVRVATDVFSEDVREGNRSRTASNSMIFFLLLLPFWYKTKVVTQQQLYCLGLEPQMRKIVCFFYATTVLKFEHR